MPSRNGVCQTFEKFGSRRPFLGPSPSPACLPLTSAVLSEISHDRETERAYLTMEAR